MLAARRMMHLLATLTSLADTFNRSNSTSTINPASDGGSWTVDAGTWGISSNQGYNVNNTGGSLVNGHMIVRRDAGGAVQELIITNVRGSSDHASGLWVNYDPSSQDGYLLIFDSTNSFGQLGRIAAGSSTAPSASPVFTTWTGGSTRLRVTSNGAGQVTVYQDTGSGWVQKAQVNDGTPATGTWVGFSTNVNTIAGTDLWDDFTATGT